MNELLPRIALSVRQPWAWLIVNGQKDIENRTWRTDFRGRVLIHAGKSMTCEEYENAYDFVMCEVNNRICMPSNTSLRHGGIVGEVEIVDCVNESASPWFVGPYGFELKNQKPLPFQPCSGKLGFFKI